jgi:hypothetical protein
MRLDDITGAIIDAAIKIHRDLGPGRSSRSMRSFWRALSNDAVFACSANVRYGSNTTVCYSKKAFALIWSSKGVS